MKNDAQIKIVMSGAALLTISSLIAKVLSAIYRIPLQNLVGNIGFYIYQQVYPIYGIGMTFALSGLPVLISKMVAEQPNVKARIGLFKRLTLILSAMAFIIFIGLQLGAPFLAQQMGDINLTMVIRAVSWMFLLMPFLSTTRGFFQGTLNMLPTAVSQVVEQVVRVLIIILVAVLAHRHHWNLYLMGRDAMLSSPISALFSSAVLLMFIWPLLSQRGAKPTIDKWALTRKIITEGGTICLLSALMIMMQLVDSFTVRNGLLASGLDQIASQSIKGTYDRAQPLVQLGLVIGTSFASAAMPSLSKSVHDHERLAFQKTAQLMMKTTLAVTLLVTVGLVILMPAINRVLFGNADGSLTIAVYCLSIIIVTLITIYNGILQSLGHFKIGFYAVLISIVIKALITEPLVARIGILGGSISTVLAVLCGLLLNWVGIKKQLPIQIYSMRFLVKLSIVTIGMVIVVLGLQTGLMKLALPFHSRVFTFIAVMGYGFVGASVAIIGILYLRLFDHDELASLPIINHWIK
ncbi:putative polysaccharide biosynthesis protein [Nicoliella lavandulae]|uniref:Polysaccharide biosynthesis protein n=1 Tax=Nicoliella lavandulae TaxID=3082954 RepID=A0ABU8SLR3_9LACO